MSGRDITAINMRLSGESDLYIGPVYKEMETAQSKLDEAFAEAGLLDREERYALLEVLSTRMEEFYTPQALQTFLLSYGVNSIEATTALMIKVNNYIGSINDTSSEGLLMTMTFSEDISHCQGLLFLATAFIRYLLKEKGSDIFNREEGTRFAEVLSANINQLEKISELMVKSVKEAEAYIRRITMEQRSTPDEQLQRVVIEEMKQSSDTSIYVALRIYSVAGPYASVRIPLSWRD